ncbi:hypothetical protein EDC04DRAFT_2609859 [Pisolithus marmoratus]|nr:hypothetical protein EDC04DRAFT_2609859 [Pisolithus marmoratus]
MDKQSFEQALLQPSIPNSSLPINLTIFHGGTSPPSTAHTECNTSDVYISSTDLFIFCEGKWERWVPSIPLRLDLYGNILYVVPCPLQGIQLISSTAACGKLINWLLWKAEVTLIEIGDAAAVAGLSKPTTNVMEVVVGPSRHKHKGVGQIQGQHEHPWALMDH